MEGQCPEKGSAGKGLGFTPGKAGQGSAGCEETGPDVSQVAFHAGYLAGHEEAGSLPPFQGWFQKLRGIQKGVSVNAAQAGEFCVLHSWNRSQKGFLVAMANMGLETH